MDLKIVKIGLASLGANNGRDVNAAAKVTTEELPLIGTGSVTKITLPERISRAVVPHLRADSFVQTVTKVEPFSKGHVVLTTQDDHGRCWYIVAECPEPASAPEDGSSPADS